MGCWPMAKWWNAVWNTLKFAVISVTLETLLGLIIALVLNTPFKGRGWVRAAVLIPWAIPTIIIGQMWGWILHDQFGILNHLLLGIGLIFRATGLDGKSRPCPDGSDPGRCVENHPVHDAG